MAIYKTSKKIRYSVSILYIIFISFILIGTYWSQQKPQSMENVSAK